MCEIKYESCSLDGSNALRFTVPGAELSALPMIRVPLSIPDGNIHAGTLQNTGSRAGAFHNALSQVPGIHRELILYPDGFFVELTADSVLSNVVNAITESLENLDKIVEIKIAA